MKICCSNTSALAHTWRASTGGTVPEDAFVGGMDHNYRMMFICSAMIEGDQTPGKVVPAHNSAMIPHNGTEVWIRNNYYVFCGAKDEFQWLQTNGEKSIPPGAVQGGVTKDGEPIYIGRVKMNGADVIGKVHFVFIFF